MNDLITRFAPLVCDDFAPDVAAVRAAVVAGGFGTETGPDGALYTGISRYPVPQWQARIEAAVGSKIIPRLSCFRLALDGELPHSWVHSDDICAKYASVLYLNLPEQCVGGTAFWQHASGMARLLSAAELEACDIDPAAYHEWMTDEWKQLSQWDQSGFVPMQFGRFVTYRTSFFHSRFPFPGFGSDASDGRLIWVCFYDKETGDL